MRASSLGAGLSYEGPWFHFFEQRLVQHFLEKTFVQALVVARARERLAPPAAIFPSGEPNVLFLISPCD